MLARAVALRKDIDAHLYWKSIDFNSDNCQDFLLHIAGSLYNVSPQHTDTYVKPDQGFQYPGPGGMSPRVEADSESRASMYGR